MKIQDFFLKFSLTYLRHRKLRSWLTMIGIFIGIASVVALIGLGEGLRSAIGAQFGSLGTDVLTVSASGGFGPPGTGVVNPLTHNELDAIKNVPGVDGAAGRIIESTKINFNDITGFGYAASMPDRESRDIIEHALNMETQKGRLLKDGDQNSVVIGARFAQEDTRFEKPMIVGKEIEVQGKEFEIEGILEEKGNQLMDNIIFMNEEDMRSLFGRKQDEYDVIAVRIVENADIEKIREDIKKELRKVRNVDEGEEDFSVQTPGSILESVNSTLLAVQIFVYIIAGISLLVGGIGIMNTMYTAVVERTGEIGIMKAIGAKNKTILKLFLLESGLLGTLGGLIGVTIGYIMATGAAYIGRLALGSDLIAARISPFLVIGALLFSFAIGSVFGTLPAIQASRLNPVDAIRT